MNTASIEHGINELNEIQIPESWLTAQDEAVEKNVPEFIKEIRTNEPPGRGCPHCFQMVKYGLEDGTWPAATSKYENAVLQ